MSSPCPMGSFKDHLDQKSSSWRPLEATKKHCTVQCIFQGWWRVLKEPGGRNAIMDLELKEDRTRKIDCQIYKKKPLAVTLSPLPVTAMSKSPNFDICKLRYLPYIIYIYIYLPISTYM